MTCGDVQELLAAHASVLDGGDDDPSVTAHVAGCAACAAEVREMRDLLAGVRRAEPREDPGDAFFDAMARDIRAAVRPVPVRKPLYAAAAVLAAAAAVILYLAAGRTPTPPPRAPAAAWIEEAREVDEELAVGSLGEADDDIEELDDAALQRATEAL